VVDLPKWSRDVSPLPTHRDDWCPVGHSIDLLCMNLSISISIEQIQDKYTLLETCFHSADSSRRCLKISVIRCEYINGNIKDLYY
jgi:hypothetical protein